MLSSFKIPYNTQHVIFDGGGGGGYEVNIGHEKDEGISHV